jgi:hypothetical protein
VRSDSEIRAPRVRRAAGAIAQEEDHRLGIVGHAESVRDHRRIDEATRPREPAAGGSRGDAVDTCRMSVMGREGSGRFERRQPDGRRGSCGGSRRGARRNLRGPVRDLVEATPVLVQRAFEDGFGGRRVLRRDDLQAPAVPVFDGGLVLQQQREHGGVFAFRISERRTAAFESRQGPARVDRMAGCAGEVIERRPEGVRQRLRWRSCGIDPAGRVHRAFLRAGAPPGLGEGVAAGVEAAGVLRCRPGAGAALAGRRVPA